MGRRRHPNQRALSSLPVELRRTSVPDEVRAWVQREAGSAVAHVVRLPGASSAAVHRLDLANGRKHYYAESFRSDALLPHDAPNGFPVDEVNSGDDVH